MNYNIPYMEKISPIFTKISGKNIPFGQMDILPVV